MKSLMIFTIILLVFANICFSQFYIRVTNDKNKFVKKYSVGDLISFYQNEIKSINDTIIETYIEGNITAIAKDSIKINYFNVGKEYYKDSKLIYSKNYNAEENENLTISYPLSDISAIYSESKLKSFGAAVSLIGLAAFVIAPVTSMNFTDLDYFNTGNYFITAALGISLGISGLVINKISEDKYLRINSLIPSLEFIKKAKITNCKINVVEDNLVK
jgi:hypothetical protein